MKFEDEPVPGYPLPILPGHVSPGRFERVLRAGCFAVTAELAPPDSADPDEVYRRARVFDGCRCHQRDRRQRCELPHVEPERVRAADARRLRAGDADLLPRPQSHRDPGRHPGRRRHGRLRNILCITGDGVQAGGHPQARPPVTLGVWTHVVGVYDPSGTPSMKIYTNGLLAATLTTGVPATMYNPPSISPSIGTRSDGTTRWDGKLDEVRIYNEALSQAQIQALPELVQNPLAFTLEPVSVTVEENQSTTFSYAFSGSPSLFVQWFENGAPVSGGLTYTIPVVPLSMDGYQYRVSISNFLYGIVSSNATLHVIPEATKPTVASVQGPGPSDQVIVKFSEAVTTASAETASNYSVSNAVGTVFSVTGATLAADTMTVTLTLASPMTEGANYVLVVNNIQDRAVTPQTILPGTTPPFTYNSLRALLRFEENTGTTTACLNDSDIQCRPQA